MSEGDFEKARLAQIARRRRAIVLAEHAADELGDETPTSDQLREITAVALTAIALALTSKDPT